MSGVCFYFPPQSALYYLSVLHTNSPNITIQDGLHGGLAWWLLYEQAGASMCRRALFPRSYFLLNLPLLLSTLCMSDMALLHHQNLGSATLVEYSVACERRLLLERGSERPYQRASSNLFFGSWGMRSDRERYNFSTSHVVLGFVPLGRVRIANNTSFCCSKFHPTSKAVHSHAFISLCQCLVVVLLAMCTWSC